jgi:hypothetical protein
MRSEPSFAASAGTSAAPAFRYAPRAVVVATNVAVARSSTQPSAAIRVEDASLASEFHREGSETAPITTASAPLARATSASSALATEESDRTGVAPTDRPIARIASPGAETAKAVTPAAASAAASSTRSTSGTSASRFLRVAMAWRKSRVLGAMEATSTMPRMKERIAPGRKHRD